MTKGLILLECPKCEQQMLAERQPEDPRRAVKVHIQCPECNAGDFDTPHYFDAKGKEVMWHEAANR